MITFLQNIKKCGKNRLDKAEALSHYLIISLSHYLGRLTIGCIVVMKRFAEYIQGFIVTLSEAKSPAFLSLTPTLSLRAREFYGFFSRYRSFRMTITHPKTEELSKIIDYSANGETGYYARGNFAKDQLKRFSPALNLKCTVGILQKTDLLNFINMQRNLHRCIYSEAA